MDKVTQAVIVFAVLGFLMVGFYLVLPGTYGRLDALDLGAQGNATLDADYTFMLGIQGIFGFLFVTVGAIAVVLVAYAFVGAAR